MSSSQETTGANQLPSVSTKQCKRKRNGETIDTVSIPPGVIIPAVVPPTGKLGRYTNQLKFLLYNVMQHLHKISDSIYFKLPVDPVALSIPAYYTVVKEPMDMSTIRKRITNKFYSSGKECQADFQRMFTNAITFNGEWGPVGKAALKLQAAFLSKVKEMPDVEVEIPYLTKAQARAKLPVEPNPEDACDNENTRILRRRETTEGWFAAIFIAEQDSEDDEEDFVQPKPKLDKDEELQLPENVEEEQKYMRIQLPDVKELLKDGNRVNLTTVTEAEITKFNLGWEVLQRRRIIAEDVGVNKTKQLNFRQRIQVIQDLSYCGHEEHCLPLIKELRETAGNPAEHDLMKILGCLSIPQQWAFRDKVIAAKFSSQRNGTWSQWFRIV